MKETSPTSVPELDFNTPAAILHRRIRRTKDKAATVGVGVGGISVIIAILLIFLYLLYEVIPLFRSASIEQQATYTVPVTSAQTLYMTMEEQAEIAMQVTANGEVVFFDTLTGQPVKRQSLPLPQGVEITSFAEGSAASHLLALGLSNGQTLIFKHRYKITYPNDQRVISPFLDFPYGEQPMEVDAQGAPLTKLAIRDTEAGLTLAAVTQDGRTPITQYVKEEDFLTMEVQLVQKTIELPVREQGILSLHIGPSQRWFYVVLADGNLDVFDLKAGAQARLADRVQAVPQGQRITEAKLLLGGISLLIGDSQGKISQWFMVRDSQNLGQYKLQPIREFQLGQAPIVNISVEHRRKGFLAVDAQGMIGIYNTTAERTLLQETLVKGASHLISISPRADVLLSLNQAGQIQKFHVDNEHPEVSWHSLWGEVWYESYDEPSYTWQSSASNNEFEPKFSLMPLAFGTLKAAFYAMLIATPLAICGAIYTAHFMAPSMRRKVKPVIELMEALPTVILGFLAGLFLAPFIELNLPGIFALLILMPIGIVAASFAWVNMPRQIRHMLPEGWDAAILIPVVILIAWFSIAMSHPLEQWFFNGDMRAWLTNDLGIPFDQRNALVVGLAMGFAVIPTIFSIAEDAIFSVPKHLSHGSLALGATPWQTLVRVVLPTASPGIFSAVMIGMGRAVGETMIVLMATGNTPIMDANIFEGMRTLAANIAVEVPESEVGSSHYRILFLAAFVLFMFTFVVNTAAEIVRQRLRKKYGAL